jgi:DNA-3-methyladenine glycosylase
MPSRGSRASVLPVGFYDRPTRDVLDDLIGKVLAHAVDGRRVSGVIVEAEAYIGEADPACHAAAGLTRRTAPLYGPPGRAYVYLNYGLHYLVNAVTEAEGFPSAVLIRALEPLEGVDTMRARRGRAADVMGLCRGPGNLTAALGITLDQNRADLTRGSLTIEDHGLPRRPIRHTPRIGIRVGTTVRWRALAVDSLAVTKIKG